MADLLERIASACEYENARGETRRARFGSDTWPRCRDAVLFNHEVDPFLEWLTMLPTWDGHRRLDRWLSNAFEVGEIDPDLLAWASRSVLLAAVQRAYRPGLKHDHVVVLVGGRQGEGKSTAWRELLPPDHPEWFSDSLVLDGRPRELIEACQGRVLAEMSELAGRTRADLERLKAFITRLDDNGIRLAYRADPEPTPRRFVLVGSANEDACLPNDPTGNRRWLAVPIASLDPQRVRDYLANFRDQLWAEAMARRTDQAWLPDRLRPTQDAHNETYRTVDSLAEDAVGEFVEQGNAVFRFQEVMAFVRDRGVTSQGNVRRALQKLGFSAKQERLDVAGGGAILARWWAKR